MLARASARIAAHCSRSDRMHRVQQLVCDTRLSMAVRFEVRECRRAVHIGQLMVGQEVAQLLAIPWYLSL